MPRLKILHIDHSVDVSGAELALSRLVRIADEDRLWKPTVIVPKPRQGDLGAFATLDSKLIVAAGPPQQPGASRAGLVSSAAHALRLSQFVSSAVRAAQLVEPEIIHSNTTRAAFVGLLVARRLRKPFVTHVRDMVSAESIGTRGFELMRRVILPRCDGVIASSSAALQTVLGYVPPHASTTALPSPIGMPRASNPPHAAGPARVIGMVARLASWKGQHLVLDAFARLVREHPNLVLRFVGDAWFADQAYATSLREQAHSLGIEGQVQFVGHVSPDLVEREISQMDICVHASITPEPLGQNVLQYLSQGKPTIAAGEGGPLEWIRDTENGLLFTPRDAENLYEKMRLLITDSRLRDRLATAAWYSSSSFDDRAIAQQFITFTNRLLET